MDSFTENLLDSLKNKKVRECIREIVYEENKRKFSFVRGDDDKCKAENATLRNLLEAIQKEKEQLLRQINEKEDYTQKLLSQLEKKQEAAERLEQRLSEMNGKLEEAIGIQDYYKNSYQELDYYYQLYVQMDRRILEELSRVLTAKSPELFLCCGSQQNNLEQLWKYLSIVLGNPEYSAKHLQSLSQIFDYLFHNYCQINPNYERLCVSVGEEFDEDIHTRADKNSRVAGNISEVVLPGYRRITDGKIMKSIVRV